jgi:MSHA biogenesis protein MshJ
MRQRLAKLSQGVDRLSLRERLMLFAAALFVLGGLWEAVLAAPLAARERLANDKLVALQDRLLQLDESLNVAAAGVSEGIPDQLERMRALRDSVSLREEELRAFMTELVDPNEMRVMLEELLRRQHGLTLVGAVNRAAQPVLEDEEAAAEATVVPAVAAVAAVKSDVPTLYRHSFVLTLRGSYLDCLAYLQSVERLPWHIYWSRLALSTNEYPLNDITIELTTLSLDEEWIGV